MIALLLAIAATGEIPRLPVEESTCVVLTENRYWTQDGDSMRHVFTQIGETDMDGHWHWWATCNPRKIDLQGRQVVFTDSSGVLRRVRFKAHVCITSDYDIEIDDRATFPLERRRGLP